MVRKQKNFSENYPLFIDLMWYSYFLWHWILGFYFLQVMIINISRKQNEIRSQTPSAFWLVSGKKLHWWAHNDWKMGFFSLRLSNLKDIKKVGTKSVFCAVDYDWDDSGCWKHWTLNWRQVLSVQKLLLVDTGPRNDHMGWWDWPPEIDGYIQIDEQRNETVTTLIVANL